MNAPPAPRTRRVALSAALAVLATVAVVFLPRLLAPASPDAGAARAQNTARSGDAVRVHVVEVHAHEGGATTTLRASGTLRAARHAPLAFAVSGVVLDVAHDEGDAVGYGDLLARLDPVPFESAVAQAEARVAYLEKSLERSRLLQEQQALSDEEFDAQTAELTGARAQLRLARWNLDRSQLRAPFDGHVLKRQIELGQVVGGGAPAFELIELATLEVEAAIAAGDLPRVDFDAMVELIARDDPRLRATGRIEHAPVRSDTRSGSVPLTVEVDNANGRLLPGMVVEATFASSATRGATELRAPLTAVRLDDMGAAAWRVTGDGRVKRVAIELGPVRGDMVVIANGLQAGDRIVDEAPDRLRDGDTVIAIAEVER